MKIAILGDIALIGKYDSSRVDLEKLYGRLKWAKTVLEECDYVIANLEAPFTSMTKSYEAKSMHLKTDPINVRVLKYLGINAVSLANNHIYDYGEKGLDETVQTLEQNGIEYVGINREPLIINDKISLQGFCCYTSNGWHYDTNNEKGKLHALTTETITDFLEKSKRFNTYPILLPHWGEENTHYPQSEHVFIAQSILKDWKCSIVGHHPHVSQGIISTSNGICAFSLGNFIFDDCYSPINKLKVIQTEDNKKGYIIVLEIEDGNLNRYSVIPYYDNKNGIEYYDEEIQKINEYSTVISSSFGNVEYESFRKRERQEAQIQRLGKRDWKWLINHLNYNSVATFIHGKKNSAEFISVLSGFLSRLNENISKEAIIYVGNFGMPTSNAAGKRVYANSLLFAKCGYNVIMIGTDPLVKGTIRAVDSSVSYLSLPNFGKSTGKKYYEWLRKWIDNNDVTPIMIVRYGSPGLATFDQYLYSYTKTHKIPLVIDVVDWLSVDSSNIIFKCVKSIDTYAEKGFFNKCGDGLIAISSYLKKYYENNYKDIIIIPPLVTEYTNIPHRNITPQIVYAGNPFRKGEKVRNTHRIKDRLDLAIKSFAVLEAKGMKFDFHIVGLSKKEYLVAFPDQQRELNQVKHIHFYGLKTMKETQEMIKKMDLSILLREKTKGTMAGFPTKIVESLALGVPVITTDTSDLRKYICDGVNGYIVDISDEMEFENRLKEIINETPRRNEEMISNIGRNKDFIIDNYVESFREFINQVIRSVSNR